VVLVGRCVDRLGKGIRGTPRDALMVDGIPVAARGRAFGFHRAADTAGAVVGPLLALAALQVLDGDIQLVLWVALVPAVMSALLVFALREPPRPAVPARAPGVAVSPEALPSAFWRVVVLLTVFSLVNFPDALLLLRLHEIGFSVSLVILAYVTYNAVYAALSYPAGSVADRLGHRLVIGVGLLVFAVAYAGLGLTENQVVASLLLAGFGAFTGLTDGVGKAWVSSLLPGHQQGTGQGVFQGLLGGGVLVAGLWAGLAWGEDGSVPLLVSGVVAGVIGLVVLVARPARTTDRSRPDAPVVL
jgi:MFS family permease